MKISAFDLNLFVVLNAIYTEGSLTKAAEVVGITQPAVSNALARLREKFDDDLFIRTGSGMTPTQKTENIILDVKKALDLMQKSVNEPDEFNPETSELTFRISLSDISLSCLQRVLLSCTTAVFGPCCPSTCHNAPLNDQTHLPSFLLFHLFAGSLEGNRLMTSNSGTNGNSPTSILVDCIVTPPQDVFRSCRPSHRPAFLFEDEGG